MSLKITLKCRHILSYSDVVKAEEEVKRAKQYTASVLRRIQLQSTQSEQERCTAARRTEDLSKRVKRLEELLESAKKYRSFFLACTTQLVDEEVRCSVGGGASKDTSGGAELVSAAVQAAAKAEASSGAFSVAERRALLRSLTREEQELRRQFEDSWDALGASLELRDRLLSKVAVLHRIEVSLQHALVDEHDGAIVALQQLLAELQCGEGAQSTANSLSAVASLRHTAKAAARIAQHMSAQDEARRFEVLTGGIRLECANGRNTSGVDLMQANAILMGHNELPPHTSYLRLKIALRSEFGVGVWETHKECVKSTLKVYSHAVSEGWHYSSSAGTRFGRVVPPSSGGNVMLGATHSVPPPPPPPTPRQQSNLYPRREAMVAGVGRRKLQSI